MNKIENVSSVVIHQYARTILTLYIYTQGNVHKETGAKRLQTHKLCIKFQITITITRDAGFLKN